MKHRILSAGIFIITALLLTVFSPCFILRTNATFESLPLFGQLDEYEKYINTSGRIPINFVDYDMLSILGEFDFFGFEYRIDGTEFLEYTYDFQKNDGTSSFSLTISASGIYSFYGPPAEITDGMQDMRRMEQSKTDIIRHNGLRYKYKCGVLTKIYWEHADLLFAFEFDDENEMDTDHPIIGKLLSRDEKDVKEGLDLLKANMYKNGFVNVPLIFWSVVALVAVAGVTVFLILRARRIKRKVLAPACTASDTTDPPSPDTP